VRRYVAGLVLPLLLLTAACGGSDDSSSDETGSSDAREGTPSDVTVTGKVGEKPTVEFKAPMSFAKTESTVLNEGSGTGEEAAANSVVTIDYVGINASTGEEFDTSYGKSPATFGLTQVIPGFQSGLIGTQAGDRVLLTINSKDGYDPTGSQDGTIKEGDSLVFVVDVLKVQNPAKLDESQVPTLELKDGKPTGFASKPGLPKTVDELGVYVVKEGTGATVEPGQTLTVNYLGAIYPDGKVFDESYTKQAATFSLSGVIQGWSLGLVGQKVGSRVILVIPSELAYGTAGQGEDIPPNADLIFVVDILKAE
jgi:peptidylprolyl isomerase